MPAAKQQQLSLFDPYDEARCYLDASRRGFFSVLLRDEDWCNAHQRSYRLELMPDVLRHLDPTRDTWISQAEFIKPNRRVVNLLRIGLLFADLDTYRNPNLSRLTPEQQAEYFVYLCYEVVRIPPPSLILFSGRGLQAKWFFDEAVPRMALPRWNAAQRGLLDRLSDPSMGEDWCVDHAARDASRVLRVVQTINSKSGQIVRVLHVTPGEDGLPVRYDFDYLCEWFLPLSRDELKRLREQREQDKAERKARLQIVQGDRKPGAGLRGFSGRTLAWHRLEDLRTLIRLRGGVHEGQRMLFLFWLLNFLLLSGATNSSQMRHEAAALAREIDPAWGYNSAELSTLYNKAKAFEAGERVEWNGKTYPPLYTPTNEHLIDLFQITDDEQRQLQTIVSEDIAKARHAAREAARRRAAGAMDRAIYEQQARERGERARALRAQGLTLQAIAEQLGVSVATVFGYVK